MRLNNLSIGIIGLATFAVSLLVYHWNGVGREAQPRSAGVRLSSSAPGPVARDDDAALRAQLAALERSQRELREQIARLERRLETVTAAAAPVALAATAVVADEEESAATRPEPPLRDPGVVPNGGDQARERLLGAGFSPAETDAIIRTVDENTLARLQLRYQAARGGDDGRQARAELRELPRAREVVRDEFGEDAYDRYLYATGQPNRIVVSGVLKSSPAQDAGLRPGDTLLALDDQPVYALHDLMRIGAAGAEADLIPLTVLREGEVMQVSVPRGPLGINARVDSVDPAAIPAG